MALSLDGAGGVNHFTAASSGTVTLSSSVTNDMIIVAVHSESINASGSHATVSSLNSTNLSSGSWAKRSNIALDAAGAGTAYNELEVWWVTSSGILTSEVITVTLSKTIDDATIIAFPVQCAAGKVVTWDPNVSIPTTATSATATTPTVTGVSTTNTPMVLGFCGTAAGAGITFNADAGWTIAAQTLNGGGTNASTVVAIEQIFGSAQSGITVPFNNGTSVNSWQAIADALYEATAGGATASYGNMTMMGVGHHQVGWMPSLDRRSRVFRRRNRLWLPT